MKTKTKKMWTDFQSQTSHRWSVNIYATKSPFLNLKLGTSERSHAGLKLFANEEENKKIFTYDVI